MDGPLTYPPEIIIESTVELPAEFYAGLGEEGINEVWFELAVLVIEFVIELPFNL